MFILKWRGPQWGGEYYTGSIVASTRQRDAKRFRTRTEARRACDPYTYHRPWSPWGWVVVRLVRRA